MRGTESLQLQPVFQFSPHFPAGLRPYWRGSYNLVFYLSLSETAAITPEYASVRYVLRVSLYSPGTEDYDLCNYFTERSRFIKLWREVNPSMPPAHRVTVNPADLKRLLAEKQEEKPIIFEHLPKECNRRILDYADWKPQCAVNTKLCEEQLSKQVGPITALLVPYVPGKQYADDKATVSKLAEMNKAGLAMLDPHKGNLLEIPTKGVVVVDLDFVFRVGDEEDVKEVTRFFAWYNAAYYAYFQEWSEVRVERNYRHTVLRTMLLLHLNGILGSTVTVDSCAGYLWALRTLQVKCAREFKWELETPYLFKILLDVNRWLVPRRGYGLSQEVLKLRREALHLRRNALSLFLQPNEFCVWSRAADAGQIEDLIAVLKDGDLFDHVFQNRACVVALIKAVQRLSAEQCRALPEPDQGPDHERTSSFACVQLMKWIQGMQRQSQALYYLLDWIRNLEYLATVMKPTIAELWNTQCSLVINFLNEKHREHGDLLDDLILQFISIGDSFAILLRHEFGSSELSFISCLVRSRSLHLSLSFPTEFLSRLFVLCSRLAEYPDKSDLVMTFVALFFERDHRQKEVLERQINEALLSESMKECEVRAKWLIKLAACIPVQLLNQFLPLVPVTMELLPSLLPKLRDDCVSGMHADVQGNIISIMRDYYRTQCTMYYWNQHDSRFEGSLFNAIGNLRGSSQNRGASWKTLRFFGLVEPGDCGLPHQSSARSRIS